MGRCLHVPRCYTGTLCKPGSTKTGVANWLKKWLSGVPELFINLHQFYEQLCFYTSKGKGTDNSKNADALHRIS